MRHKSLAKDSGHKLKQARLPKPKWPKSNREEEVQMITIKGIKQPKSDPIYWSRPTHNLMVDSFNWPWVSCCETPTFIGQIVVANQISTDYLNKLILRQRSTITYKYQIWLWKAVIFTEKLVMTVTRLDLSFGGYNLRLSPSLAIILLSLSSTHHYSLERCKPVE